MADFTALGRAHTTRLTVGGGRHVVVMHVVLLVDRIQGVQHLVHLRHCQCAYIEHLGFATLEQASAMGGGDDADLGTHRTQITGATAIHTDALVHHSLANHLLGKRTYCFLDFLLTTGELAAELLHDGLGGCISGLVAIGLDDDRGGGLDELGAHRLHGLPDVGAVIEDRRVLQGLTNTGYGHQLTLQFDGLVDPHLAGFETLGNDLFGDLGGAVLVVRPRLLGATCFHHHDGHIAVVELASSHHDLEGGFFTLFVGGMGDPLAVLAERHPDRTNGTVKWDAADHQCRAGAVDGEHVVRVLLISAEHGGDDLGFVAEAVRERRTQGPVGEAAGEDCRVGGTTFTTEERTGDLAGGVGPLLHVDGEREEIDAITNALGGVGGDENGGAPNGGHHGALALLGQSARFERQHLVGAADGG